MNDLYKIRILFRNFIYHNSFTFVSSSFSRNIMPNNVSSRNLVLIFAWVLLPALLLTYSCNRRYEDGPTISLQSRQARVINDWKAIYVSRNDYDDTKLYTEFNLSIDKETFVWTINKDTTTGSIPDKLEGSWRLQKNDRAIQLYDAEKKPFLPPFSPSFTSLYSQILMDIYRLKEDQLWVRYQIGTDYYYVQFAPK